MTQLSFEAFEDWRASGRPAEGERQRAPRREFLGWHEAPLERAARWIVDSLGADDGLRDVVVALPGARAARALQECLARALPPRATPPTILTQGALTDVLVSLELPAAGRLARTLAWEEALRELPPELSARLARTDGASTADARRERLRLAETVRALHGELAPEGLDFESVLAARVRPELEAEAARWEALARAQRTYRALLERFGLCDPHDARRRALEEGRVERSLSIVLVGVVDMNALLARTLELVADKVSVLVVAPPEEAHAFDALGRLHARAWLEREVPFDRARWSVCEKPVDQADVACERIASWNARYAPHEVRFCVADESVVPYLERRLASDGVRARHAAGMPIARTRPFRLLRAVARYLRRGGFAELAALGRDQDLAQALARVQAGPAALDRYHCEHLPAGGRGPWIEPAGPEDGERSSAGSKVARLHAELERVLGGLAAREPRALTARSRELRAFLVAVYPRPLDPEEAADHALGESLRILGLALGQMEEVHPGLMSEGIDAAGAIELLLRSVNGERVPPAPARERERVVELIGWLDAPLDDAPAMIVTGFNEGRVPQSVEGHAFLPDALRARLGLPTGDERLARDAYATCVLAQTRAELVFVTGRRSNEGDPLVPSRLSFRCPEHEVVARVRAFLGQAERPLPVDPGRAAGPPPALPRPERWDTPTRMRVSAFGVYLRSPYLFFLEHVLKLETLDDRTRELDARTFGSLAHEVLQAFGERGPRESMDEGEIHAFLVRELEGVMRARFGPAPLPAVGLQFRQLEHRLKAFATQQAAHARAGWRIEHVEWRASGPDAALVVDGVPMALGGQIDRIDVHPDGRWAIIDYKAGEKTADPERVHRRRDRSWKSLQLPLYRHLARSLDLPGEPWLGFFALGKSEAEIGFQWASWTPETVELALERACDVVRSVRAGEFWSPGDEPYEEILHALWGDGLRSGALEATE